MAAACGQSRHICSYDVKGIPCGKVLDSDAELMAHLKTHISQNSNTNTNVLTPKDSLKNNQQTINGNGKMKSSNGKNSQNSSVSPKQQNGLSALGTPILAHLPQQQQSLSNNNNGQRFHPYSKTTPQQQQHAAAVAAAQQQQQVIAAAMQQHHMQQQLAQQQQQQQQAQQQFLSMQYAAAQYELMAAAAASMPNGGAIPGFGSGMMPHQFFGGAMPLALQAQQIIQQQHSTQLNEKLV